MASDFGSHDTAYQHLRGDPSEDDDDDNNNNNNTNSNGRLASVAIPMQPLGMHHHHTTTAGDAEDDPEFLASLHRNLAMNSNNNNNNNNGVEDEEDDDVDAEMLLRRDRRPPLHQPLLLPSYGRHNQQQQQQQQQQQPLSMGSGISSTSGSGIVGGRHGGGADWPADVSLDRHLARVYEYYRAKGFRALILSRVVHLISMLFIVCFSIFLTICVDYSEFSQTEFYNGTIQLKDAIDMSRLRPTTADPPGHMPPIVIIFLVLFSLYWVWNLFYLIRSIPSYYRMKRFYQDILKIQESDVETTEWPDIVNSLIKAYRARHPSKKLDHTDIANRILRRENYWIALFHCDVINLRLSCCGFQSPLLMTKWVEWVLRWSILDSVFDENNNLLKKYLRPENRKELENKMKWKFFWFGAASLVFAPFIIMFLLAYFLFRYGEAVHKNPHSLGFRQYTEYSRIKFREYNEYPHEFERRLNASYQHAADYLANFPSELLSIVAQLVAFVFGSFAFVMAIASIINEDLLLNLHITEERSMLWYFGVFSAIFALANALTPEDHAVFEPEKLMKQICYHTHYLPAQWQDRAHTNEVRGEFAGLFQYKLVVFFVEILGVLALPLILLFNLRYAAENISFFFEDHTTKHDRVGYICDFAAFDFHVARSPQVAGKPSNDGKMQQSFYTFAGNNPDYKPDKEGESFLQSIRDYTSMGSSQMFPSGYYASMAATSPPPANPWVVMAATSKPSGSPPSSSPPLLNKEVHFATSSPPEPQQQQETGQSSGASADTATLSTSESQQREVSIFDRIATGME